MSCFKVYIVSLLTVCILQKGAAQQKELDLTITEVFDLAEQKSLMSLKSHTNFLVQYWNFRSYQASLLPYIGLNLTPSNYNRAWVKRYDPENNVDVFREQQTYEASASLFVEQNVGLTGGTFYLRSGLSTLQNFNNPEYSVYNVAPFQVTYQQSIFGFNQFKWDKLIAPLSYELSQQEYLENQQRIKIEVIQLYFELVLIQAQKEIAEQNVATSDTLYAIGKRRFKIASIAQDELLNLELASFQAKIELTKLQKNLQKARFNLNSFLRLEKNTVVNVSVPSFFFDELIDIDRAVEKAITLNPKMLNLKKQNYEADRDLDKAVKESRMEADLMVGVGMNNSDKELKTAYADLGQSQSQLVNISLEVPIADWGMRKGRRLMAEKQSEMIHIETQQEQINFEQQVTLKVMDYNLQPQMVASNQKASEIAAKAYEITKKRFLLGKADVMKMNNSYKNLQETKERYINALYQLWKMYYEVQQMTLYDFKKGQPLVNGYEDLITK